MNFNHKWLLEPLNYHKLQYSYNRTYSHDLQIEYVSFNKKKKSNCYFQPAELTVFVHMSSPQNKDEKWEGPWNSHIQYDVYMKNP